MPAIVAALPSAPAVIAATPSAPAAPAVPAHRAAHVVVPTGMAKTYDVPSYARKTFAHDDARPPVVRPLGHDAEPTAPPVHRIQGLSLEELAAIRAELWDEPDARRTVLKRHGLSELRWRIVERAWAAELESMLTNPATVGEAVSRMRSAGARRTEEATA